MMKPNNPVLNAFESLGKYTTFPCEVVLDGWSRSFTLLPAYYAVTADTEFGKKTFKLGVTSDKWGNRKGDLFPSVFTFSLGHNSPPTDVFRMKLASLPTEQQLKDLGQALDNAILTFPGVEVVEDDPEPESVDSKLTRIAAGYAGKTESKNNENRVRAFVESIVADRRMSDALVDGFRAILNSRP